MYIINRTTTMRFKIPDGWVHFSLEHVVARFGISSGAMPTHDGLFTFPVSASPKLLP